MATAVSKIGIKGVNGISPEKPVNTDRSLSSEQVQAKTDYRQGSTISNNFFSNYGFIKNLGQARQYANDVLNTLKSSDKEEISNIVNDFGSSVASVLNSTSTENAVFAEEVAGLLSDDDATKADDEKMEKAVETVKTIMDRLNKTEVEFVESRNTITEDYQPIESEEDAEEELKKTEDKIRNEQEKFLRTHANDVIFRLLIPFFGIQ